MAVIVSMAAIAISVLTGDPALAYRAFVGGLASLAGHWTRQPASRGRLGFGDVKRSGTLGMATSSITPADSQAVATDLAVCPVRLSQHSK
jgi:hypothetical protein